MMNLIAKLQAKPVGVRRNIAVFTTICIGLIVIAIWASLSFLSPQKEDKAKGVSPFESIKNLFLNIKENFNFKK